MNPTAIVFPVGCILSCPACSTDGELIIIGVDCAADFKKIGLARATWQKGAVPRVDMVEANLSAEAVLKTITSWAQGKQRVLLALDAPLGWPVGLGDSLHQHAAGVSIVLASDKLFLRETDRYVWDTLGKKPLEVGADRIARTAAATLKMLDQLRETLAAPLPLAWTARFNDRVACVEVYPAGTLYAMGKKPPPYKKPDQVYARREILKDLSGEIKLRADPKSLEASADALDAVICVVAGVDFLSGRCTPPTDEALAKREGWIWFRRR